MSGLTARQESGIATLLQTGNVAQSAKIVGVSERQFWRWMDDADFAAELRRQQDALTSGAFMRLQSALSGAMDVLAAIAFDTSIAPAVRLRAADSIVSHTLRWRESVDLAARVAELEYSVKMAQAEVEAFENATEDANGITIIDYRRGLKAPDGYQHT